MSSSKLTIVLTCLVNFQEYILDCIHNLTVHGNENIVVITEPEFFSKFSGCTLIDVTTLSDEFNFNEKSKLDKSFRGGLCSVLLHEDIRREQMSPYRERCVDLRKGS